MLDKIKLKFTNRPDVELSTAGITVFVGPNNSGKSLVLRELWNAFGRSGKPNCKLLSDFDPLIPEGAELDALINQYTAKDNENAGAVVIPNFEPTGEWRQHAENPLHLRGALEGADKYGATNAVLRFFSIYLDSDSRLRMVLPKELGNLKLQARSMLASIYLNDTLRSEVQLQILASLNLHFVLDPTEGGRIQISYADRPMPKGLERSLKLEAINFFQRAIPISEMSDGIKAFTGIYLAVKCGVSSTILIDEPEAFLHPPLAKKLGGILARAVADGQKSLLVATHSADFLLGCLQSSDKVQVVRLEYSEGLSSCRVVDSAQLQKFCGNPLIRSANVMAGLFHDGVVVTESDNDRAFYSEIYFRLSEQDEHLPSLLFVNTQGKHTIHQVMSTLRSFGVPTAGLPDIDILMEGGANFASWLKSAGIPEAIRKGLEATRSNLAENVKVGDLKLKLKEQGVGAFEVDDKNAANKLFDQFENYGIFAVRIGELECWLKYLNVRGKKTEWAVSMLESLGGDPKLNQYVKPGKDDVWGHLLRIANWVKNPSREGMT
jgi:AAA domain, putative AbiEii toxin, Type IV TA system